MDTWTPDFWSEWPEKAAQSFNEREQILEERIDSLKKEKILVDDKWVQAQRAFDEAKNAGELEKVQAESISQSPWSLAGYIWESP